MLKCLFKENEKLIFCNYGSYQEIIPVLIRRIILPFYIPIITLISSLLLLKSNKIFLKSIQFFLYGFLSLIISELLIRYTGLNYLIRQFYVFFPIILISFIYLSLIIIFSKETK